MANQNITNLDEIINQIEKNQILLPDFQREFVWKDLEQQKQIVASVLCKMPIGSILLLESDPNEYAAKVIGCSKKYVNTSQIEGKVAFLLDGQQRITVLTNVFSNVIHNKCSKVSELIAPMALKRRFFLKLPKWKDRPDLAEDWFGVGKLNFPIENPRIDFPEFLTSQILKYIHVESFNANDKKPYNPSEKLAMVGVDLKQYCVGFETGYLIPLFLVAKPVDSREASYWLGQIISGVAKCIENEIMGVYLEKETEERETFVKYIFENEASDICGEINSQDAFSKALEQRREVWKELMQEYLASCKEALFLDKIVVKASQRARAIDIYENLNRGGVCLNTFDLIMARVAKVSKENFIQRMRRLMMQEKKYPQDVMPTVIHDIIRDKIQNNTYNATENMLCYNLSKNELNAKYVDIFLDVLSLYSYAPELKSEQIKLDYIKKSAILSLKPEQIDENCEVVIEAIDRAMFFLQTRCGIRSMQEINYSLMVVLIAIVFIEKEYFANRDIHNLLEGWYWAALFSGEYDKDQNTTFISNLKNMLKTIRKKEKIDWIKSIKENVFSMTNFSDKEFLLMEKTAEDRYPKKIFSSFVCQYMIAQTYFDMFVEDKKISVFCDEAMTLEKHHIVPLGSVKKVGETTITLRKNPKHICNSPLNFVLITQAANKDILNDSLDVYAKKITAEAKADLYISSYTSREDVDTDEKIHDILSNRFDMLKGKVLGTISERLTNWK